MRVTFILNKLDSYLFSSKKEREKTKKYSKFGYKREKNLLSNFWDKDGEETEMHSSGKIMLKSKGTMKFNIRNQILDFFLIFTVGTASKRIWSGKKSWNKTDKI